MSTARPPLLRSLVLLSPSLHSHRILKTYYSELTETQLTHRRLATNLCHRKTKAPMPQCVHCTGSLSSDAPPIADVSTLVGTSWSSWEPAALRSSPAHPRSWQAPFPCPSRARKCHALYPHCTYRTPLRFHKSITIALSSPRGHTRLNLAIAER
jgi:hypothetical protein